MRCRSKRHKLSSSVVTQNKKTDCMLYVTWSFPLVMAKLSSLLLEASLSLLTGVRIVVPTEASSGTVTVYSAVMK